MTEIEDIKQKLNTLTNLLTQQNSSQSAANDSLKDSMKKNYQGHAEQSKRAFTDITLRIKQQDT